MQIYQGDYLPEVSGAWVLPEQERLRQAFMRGGLQLARLYLETGQSKPALELTERLMTTDACQEEAYLVAMQVYAAEGNRTEVARLYERLSDNLEQELNTSPSGQVESLYQSVAAGQM